MKKNVKRALAAVCLLPFAFSGAACANLTEVSEAERESVYGDYLTRYESALVELSERESLYLNYYVSTRESVEQGENKRESKMTAEADLDATSGKQARAATTVEQSQSTTTADGTTTLSQKSYLYALADGVYQKTVQTEGDNVTEEKSFTAKAEGAEETFTVTDFFAELPTFAELSAQGDVKLFADANGRGMRIEYSFVETGVNYGGLDVEGLETVAETTYSITLRFDVVGKLLTFETEMIMRFNATAPTANAPESGEGEGGVEAMSESGEGGGENTLPPNGKAYERYYVKATVKDGSSVKLPSATELETYKQ